MCGIFSYLHYNLSREQKWVLQTLLTGLRRLEYRGYDSAGVCLDDVNGNPVIFRATGNIDALEQSLPLDSGAFDASHTTQTTIAHTRWATHGEPAPRNAHPQPSDASNSFVVVHNGIINNFSTLKETLHVKHGYKFSSETDTEVIAVLLLYIYENCASKPTFGELVAHATAHLEGAFALLVKSKYYPGELVATKVGSPLVIGLMEQTTGAEVVSDGAQSIPITVTSRPVTDTAGEIAYIDFSVVSSGSAAEATTAAATKKTTTAKKKKKAGAGGGGAAADVAASTATAVSTLPTPPARPSSPAPPREYICSSDSAAIMEHTNRVIFLEDHDVAHFSANGVLHMTHGRHGHHDASAAASSMERPITTLEGELDSMTKGAYEHYMLKEIYEQSETVFNTMRGRVNFETYAVTLGGLKQHIESIRRSRRLIFIACGTSYNAAVATRQLVEEVSQLPVDVQLASDFLDRQTPIFRDECCFFVSQSGETADTLQALRYCVARGALTVGIVNRVASAIARDTACGVYTNAGIEVGVASTKAYTSQIIAIVLIALAIGQDRVSAQPKMRAIVDALRALPGQVQSVLNNASRMRALASEFLAREHRHNIILIGRGYQYATCREAALKVKEIAYIHCEAVMAGELKHGPLALVDENTNIFMVLTRDSLYAKTLNALRLVVARKGRPWVLVSAGDEQHVIEAANSDNLDIAPSMIVVPSTHECLQGVLNVIPFQLLAYYLALDLGFSVDRPRNLAKSVTVQ